jgi:phage tail sheath protein FI
MPVSQTFPGIYIEELPSSAHTITAAPTSVAVFVGYSHPFKTLKFATPIELFSFTDYERNFGGFFVNSVYDPQDPKRPPDFASLAHAVNQFFLNGGSDCFVVGLQSQSLVDSQGEIGGARVQFADSGSAAIEFTAREPTDDAHVMTIEVDNARATGGGSAPLDAADLTITYGADSGAVVEKQRGVSLARTLTQGGRSVDNPNFIETRLGTAKQPLSSLVTVRGTGPAGSEYPPSFPAGKTKLTFAAAPQPPAGGAVFNVADFTDVFQQDSPLDKLPIFNILALPGVTKSAVLNAASAFVEQKRAFFIIDPPAPTLVTPDGAGGTQSADALVDNLAPLPPPLEPPPLDKNCAFYFPYLRSSDPLTGNAIELPPSGTVAGVFARTDLNRGVWKAPAGLETTTVNTLGVVESGKMTDLRQGVLNKVGVNCLREFPGSGTVVFGARTLVVSNPALKDQWGYVPVRRMALFLEQTLYTNLGWVVFEPNAEPTWTAIRNSIEAFMLGLFRQGAFQGTKPSEAFQVKCDDQTTTQDDINKGMVNIVVAFAPLKPAEFVIVKIAQLAGQPQAA